MVDVDGRDASAVGSRIGRDGERAGCPGASLLEEKNIEVPLVHVPLEEELVARDIERPAV